MPLVDLVRDPNGCRGFNAVALASGTPAQAAPSAFLQLSQALGSGRLQGDEYAAVAEQVPGHPEPRPKEMGVTVGELKELGGEGKITSDVPINALAKGFEQNKDKIQELLRESPTARFKALRNSTDELSGRSDQRLLPAAEGSIGTANILSLMLPGEAAWPVSALRSLGRLVWLGRWAPLQQRRTSSASN